jgi:acetolactate synthase-1/2/3 large subunit
MNEIRTWEARDAERSTQVKRNQEYPDPISILDAIRAETGGEAIVVTDVGQHQMWTARCYSPGHGPIATLPRVAWERWALLCLPPWASKWVCRTCSVWVVAGDGGIQMNIQELATLQQQGIAVKVAIMNNGYLGMVRQWQQFFHSRNYSETPITGPDYVKLADAYGLSWYACHQARGCAGGNPYGDADRGNRDYRFCD